MKLREIKINGTVVGYSESTDETKRLLPSGSILNVSNENGVVHMDYATEEVEMRYVNKEFGIYAGDVCTICRAGILVDAGGCATCPRCGSQLKCGL